MIRTTVGHLAGGMRRGLGWQTWALVLACLIVLACAATSFAPRKSTPGPSSPPSPAARVGETQANFIPDAGSRVELQGTSTLGDWISRSTDIQGKVVIGTDAATLNALFDHIQATPRNNDDRVQSSPPTLSVRSPPAGVISVPILSLRGDSLGMDHDMYIALKAKQHPSIEYVFQKAQQAALQWNPGSRQTDLKLGIVGTLTMAGVARVIAMDVTVQRDPRRHFLAQARTELLMTDFGMTRPGALFGLIKAGDRVVVVFDLDLVLEK